MLLMLSLQILQKINNSITRLPKFMAIKMFSDLALGGKTLVYYGDVVGLILA